jgi:hypothetical protein
MAIPKQIPYQQWIDSQWYPGDTGQLEPRPPRVYRPSQPVVSHVALGDALEAAGERIAGLVRPGMMIVGGDGELRLLTNLEMHALTRYNTSERQRVERTGACGGHCAEVEIVDGMCRRTRQPCPSRRLWQIIERWSIINHTENER